MRDQKSICIVQDSIDAYAIESTNNYNGSYHILNGYISQINGIGNNELNIS